VQAAHLGIGLRESAGLLGREGAQVVALVFEVSQWRGLDPIVIVAHHNLIAAIDASTKSSTAIAV
jgi:hypothetical protein